MKISPALLVIGSLLVYWASVYLMVILPTATMGDAPSEIWRAWTEPEKAGHDLYVNNGCHYCHSLFIRNNDWDIGAERIAKQGDYYGQQPAILGTERTGPDLSQDGGEHGDDWHIAHFVNPRFTRPQSLMPSWEFLGERQVRELTAYVQSQGLKMADARMDRQRRWQKETLAAWARGPEANIEWLHSMVPDVWRRMPNPYPANEAGLLRGKKVYQDFCIGCHGPVGDGEGRAKPYLNPPPLNFTILRKHLVEGKYIGGIFYYQVMNGVTGSAMPYFKKDLESEKIWDVSNYLAVYFVGYTDANIEPRGIDASYEPPYRNPYLPPSTQPQTMPAPGNPPEGIPQGPPLERRRPRETTRH